MQKRHFLVKPLILSLSLTFNFPITSFASPEGNKSKQIPMEDVQRFSNALNDIKKYYVKPVDDNELFDNAIKGMLSGLDPHSSYLDEESYKDLQTSTSGEFGGLGLEVTMQDGVIKVVTPMIDTPAYKAGIKTGDYIIKLGDTSVQGLTLKDAVNLMRGNPGTPIELTVLRKGESKPLKFTLVREVIHVKSVQSSLYDGEYGYIRLAQFQADTGNEMLKAIAQLKQQAGGHLKGLVLDLRNNPGGLLDTAIQVADAFIDNQKKDPKKLIVFTKGRLPGSNFSAIATPGDVLDNAPLVVLINGGSASASEIVAGALKDDKRGIIIGTKSFGKGSVQTILPLDATHGIKLTTALYYTPSGVSIQAKGITPEIIVDELQLPKLAIKSDDLGYSEADLKGHLQNTQEQKSNKKEQSQNSNEKLMHEDYQLYAAMTILKGLVFAHR